MELYSFVQELARMNGFKEVHIFASSSAHQVYADGYLICEIPNVIHTEATWDRAVSEAEKIVRELKMTAISRDILSGNLRVCL